MNTFIWRRGWILIILVCHLYFNQSDILFAQGSNPVASGEKPKPWNYMPGINFNKLNSPEEGYYYLAFPPNILLVIDNSGTPVFIRHTVNGVNNFSLQTGNVPVYYDLLKKCFIGLNSFLQPHDTFRISGSGYTTDYHMFQIFENRHVLMMGYEYRLVDMSHLVPGGKVNATVTGTVIQEMDENGNLVYEWKSLDHVTVTGADPCFVDLTDDVIDYFHGNSVIYTADGNFLVSARNMSQVLKINRLSGEIMWRMGGPDNEFDFINDSGFSGQHSLTLLPGNKLVLFDNGNCRNPQYSRAVVLQYDEEEKTVELLAEMVRPPGVFSSFMGNAQVLPAGNVLIGWGQNNKGLIFTEFDGSSQAVDVSADLSVWSYSVYKDSWNPTIFRPEKDSLNFGMVNINEWNDICLKVYQQTQKELTLDYINIPDQEFEMLTSFPITLGPEGSADICFRFRPKSEGSFNTKITLYSDETKDDGLVDISAFQIFAEGKAQNPTINMPIKENITARIKVFPNPCTDYVYLSLSGYVSKVRITSTTGRIINEWTGLKAGDNYISTSSWIDGIYIVNVFLRNSQVISNLLVKISGRY